MSVQEYDVLVERLRSGRIGRRAFIRRMIALGVGGPLLLEILAACSQAAPAASPSASAAAAASAAAGKRGGMGELKLLWWQAPTILNPHLARGTKDFDASQPVFEPLGFFDQHGDLVPALADGVPSLENGQVAKDGSSVTWKVKKGVLFHDGKPMTADDVVFTWEYVTDKATGSTSAGLFKNVSKVEATDDHTVKVSFQKPTPSWSLVFTGGSGAVLPRHAYEAAKGTASRTSPLNSKPIGTGPYRVKEFQASDHVNYELFDQYHVPTEPHFDAVFMKGGGDSDSAARAVLQTGEFDWAWNIQSTPQVLAPMLQAGKGVLVITPGGSIERIVLNQTDPNKTVDGERSSVKAPHPFFSDEKVRQAFGLAVQRDVMAEQLYGKTGRATANILNAPEKYLSTNTSWKYDLTKAAQLLDEAGWKKGSDGIRQKNGVRMAVVFQTTVLAVRQSEQAIVKAGLEKLGVDVTLKSTKSNIFFSTDPGNPDTYEHFYADMEMYTSGPAIDPQSFFLRWLSSEIAQKANNWSTANVARYSNPDFDKLWNESAGELDPVKRGRLIVAMNDHVVDHVVEIPLVARNDVAAASGKLTGTEQSTWESELWAIGKWGRKS